MQPLQGGLVDLMAADQLVARAYHALQSGRFGEAAQLAQQALDEAPDRPDAVRCLGYALISLDRPKDAVTALEHAARESDNSELVSLYAMALRRSNRLDEAVTWFGRALALTPLFPAAFFELAMLHASQRRTDAAIDTLKRGVEASPRSAEMVAQLGHLYYGANDRKNAAECFRRALALQPGHGAAREALGMVLMHDHAFDEAAGIFQRMIALDPSNIHARIHLGSCLLGLGDREGAAACFREASAKGPLYFGRSLRVLVGSPRGRFWLKPSDAAKFLIGS